MVFSKAKEPHWRDEGATCGSGTSGCRTAHEGAETGAEIVTIGGGGLWGCSVGRGLCVAVCPHGAPLSPPPLLLRSSHLPPSRWASSNLAWSDGATGALCVSSPQDCQKSSVKSPHRLALRASRKLTRRGETLYAATVLLLTADKLGDLCSRSFQEGK